MEPTEAATELSAEPTHLATLLAGARDAYQSHLVAVAKAKSNSESELERALTSVRVEAERFHPDASLLDRYAEVWNRYGELGGPADIDVPTASSLREAEDLWSDCLARCDRDRAAYREVRNRYEADRKKLFGKPKTEPRITDRFRVDLWTMKQVLDDLPRLRQEHIERASASATTESTVRFESERLRFDADIEERLSRARADISFAVEVLGDLGMPWPMLERDENKGFVKAREHGLARVGRFESVVAQAAPFEVPCVIQFPGTRALAIDSATSRRDDATSLLRSVVLRCLMSMPPGRLHLSIFDAIAMGGSFADFLHLGDYDEALIDSKPHTAAREIEGRLEEHVAHLETVVSKYLRGQFASIQEYNEQAEEVAEPYRLVVVCDFPAQFTPRSTELLQTLIENGARCGIHVALSIDPDAAIPGGASHQQLLKSADRILWTGQNVQIETAGKILPIDIVPDRCPQISFNREGRPETLAADFLVNLGVQAQKAEVRIVELAETFRLIARHQGNAPALHLPVLRAEAPPINPQDSSSWWTGETSGGATAILGRAGAQAVAPLYFSSTDIAGGALMVGLPRSGKTTSLHAAILSMAITYSPDELELYLIDAKHGVEFNAYRGLPHARMVAINSEREFAVAVLTSLDREIARRAELMKMRAPGRTNLRDFREATGEQLARIVVIIDEFHEIFEEDDRLGREAFAAFSNIVRQGPFAGVHLVLASQTLSSMPAMDRNTLTLLPARVAFACNESDGQIVMGDSNPDVRFLSRAGEGLLNAHRGDPVHNLKFQGTLIAPDHRERLVEQVITKAGEGGWHRRPRVFDGDSLADRAQVAPEVFVQPADKPLRVQFVAGEPLSLEEHLLVTLRRAEGQNVLLLGPADDDGVPESALLGVLHSLLLAAAKQVAEVHLIDLVNDEGGVPTDGVEGRVSLGDLAPELGIDFHHRRSLRSVLEKSGRMIAERVELEDYRSPGVVLVIVGVQRAAELDPNSYEEDAEAAALRAILRDGPEVGVHTVLVADTFAGVTRRLGPDALADVSVRIAGQLPGDQDRQIVLDAYQPIEIRHHQLVLFDRDRDRRQKFRPYGPISQSWLTLASLDARLGHDS